MSSNPQAIEKSSSMSLSAKAEAVLVKGDLQALSEQERVLYYQKVCESVGLNPLTQPFSYIVLNNKLVLYANKTCTDQLRSVHRISIEIVSREKVGDVYVVTARARGIDGRTDESTGAVAVQKASGDTLANLYMKAETKAKRRVTLSICGLGLLDETEVETISGAKPYSTSASTSRPPAQIETRMEVEEPPHPLEAAENFHLEPEQEEKSGNIDPSERIIEYGKKYRGQKFGAFSKAQIQSFVDWMEQEGKNQRDDEIKFLRDAAEYLADEIPF